MDDQPLETYETAPPVTDDDDETPTDPWGETEET
jgi:hypothetical protein